MLEAIATGVAVMAGILRATRVPSIMSLPKSSASARPSSTVLVLTAATLASTSRTPNAAQLAREARKVLASVEPVSAPRAGVQVFTTPRARACARRSVSG